MNIERNDYIFMGICLGGAHTHLHYALNKIDDLQDLFEHIDFKSIRMILEEAIEKLELII